MPGAGSATLAGVVDTNTRLVSVPRVSLAYSHCRSSPPVDQRDPGVDGAVLSRMPADGEGASLIAQPLRRVFSTLSAWQDRDALYTFARAQPHRGIMASLRPVMRSSTLTFWNVPAEELPLTWDDAKQSQAEQARAPLPAPGPALCPPA